MNINNKYFCFSFAWKDQCRFTDKASSFSMDRPNVFREHDLLWVKNHPFHITLRFNQISRSRYSSHVACDLPSNQICYLKMRLDSFFQIATRGLITSYGIANNILMCFEHRGSSSFLKFCDDTAKLHPLYHTDNTMLEIK